MTEKNSPNATPANLARAPFSLDAGAIAWVTRTRDALSTEQKVRQIFNLACHGDDPAQIEHLASLQVGGITRFGGTDLEASWRGTRSLIERSEIPLLISGDIEGGAIGIPFGTRITNQLGLAATGSPALADEAVSVLAAEARALGYNWTFTPVLDINAAFRSAIVATRSYGSNVETILEHGLVNVRAFQRAGIAATAKHWPGEGFDDRDQHLVTTINPLDMDAWRERFGRLYQGLIDAGVMTVMSAHIALPAYAKQFGASGLELYRPASVSRFLNLDLLRGELGFNGLIVSDDRAECIPEVISSGCDVLLFPSPFEADFGHVMKALSDGRISEARLEDAVTRVLGLKAALGLHCKSIDELMPPLPQARAVVRSAPHLAVEKRVASAAITLVKDVRHTLPLSVAKHRRIVVCTDSERGGFAGQPAMELIVERLLGERGFELRAFDPQKPPTPADTDLVLYLLAQESLLVRSHIYLDWARVHGSWQTGMRRYWHDLPCVLVSFGHPYYLYDAPRLPCVVNAYTAIEPVQQALVRKLLGDEPFTGAQPVDSFCGLPDAHF
jgi:beta-N-acetylhexosaminidase